MTGSEGGLTKMFRWLKDRKKGGKASPHRKGRPEDDYGFRKKQIILQETENGHSVIIKDDEKTLVYPQSFGRFHFRARMPTPVQNFRETSNHIYDEIPERYVRSKIEFDTDISREADLIRDTRPAKDSRVDFSNAIEVGPYLIVPLVNSQTSKPCGDVEIFKRDCDEKNMSEKCDKVETKCTCKNPNCLQCSPVSTWISSANAESAKAPPVVLTRCESSSLRGLKHATEQIDDQNNSSNLCSFSKGAQTNCAFRIFADSPGADSNSRTLTGTPDSNSRTLTGSPDFTQTPDSLSERSDDCAIKEEKVVKYKKRTTKRKSKTVKHKDHADGNETGYEYDLSTSGDSERSRVSEHEDYKLYLSKIESNLQLKHDVRKLVQDVETVTIDTDENVADSGDLASMTYVSSLSEYSTAASQVSDISADKSCSDDSGGFYECMEDTSGTKNAKTNSKMEHRVSLERSVSAPDGRSKKKTSRKHKDKTDKPSKTPGQRSKSFDCRVYKALTDEERELYKFPSAGNSSSSLPSRTGRGKPAPLAPQPTPVYMEPYRGKSRSHNRLLGDLIRMNYDKQLFFH
ncbi:uncharacterized protein LOC128233465 [Mya arenaria]|uniref:uncharacterized protein LOC128233465 n=1 Tax=Mya arenaria TaxID=6604 RepID=UPI0022E3CF85|nr:uncharacterized protein LOC128233465 [Mya arenaria]XP_052803107.1 uncharacterized protein LOC128233465 [Mya arenaria]XP_052803108.1 uncharacterized protein LOC128233465 [Mya arenaria]